MWKIGLLGKGANDGGKKGSAGNTARSDKLDQCVRLLKELLAIIEKEDEEGVKLIYRSKSQTRAIETLIDVLENTARELRSILRELERFNEEGN